MKKLLFLLLLLPSCVAFQNIPVNYTIGESEQQFREENKKQNLSVIQDNQSYTLYAACNSCGLNCLYFLFRNNRLCEMSEGVRQPDIVIENR